jgi:hypothetical protein
MLANVFDMLFGCWHKNYTFPITTRKNGNVPAQTGAKATYVVCLDCGKEFPYDWNKMKVMSNGEERVPATALPVQHITGFGKAA